MANKPVLEFIIAAAVYFTIHHMNKTAYCAAYNLNIHANFGSDYGYVEGISVTQLPFDSTGNGANPGYALYYAQILEADAWRVYQNIRHTEFTDLCTGTNCNIAKNATWSEPKWISNLTSGYIFTTTVWRPDVLQKRKKTKTITCPSQAYAYRGCGVFQFYNDKTSVKLRCEVETASVLTNLAVCAGFLAFKKKPPQNCRQSIPKKILKKGIDCKPGDLSPAVVTREPSPGVVKRGTTPGVVALIVVLVVVVFGIIRYSKKKKQTNTPIEEIAIKP